MARCRGRSDLLDSLDDGQGVHLTQLAYARVVLYLANIYDLTFDAINEVIECLDPVIFKGLVDSEDARCIERGQMIGKPLAQGYPDMRSLRLTQGYKIVQDFVRFVCNVVYLASTKEKSQDAAVEAFFVINILISLAGIVLAAMVLMMKSSILIEIEENGGTTSAATRSEKSKGDDSSVAHDEEAG